MATRFFGFLIALYSLGVVGYQLEVGALVTRQFKPDASRKEHPVKFWIMIAVQAVFGLIGAAVFFFGPFWLRA